MSHKPATAYDYRRYILLTQALSEFSVESELRAVLMKLVKEWKLPLRDDAPYSWLETVPTIQIVQMLAQFIVRYHSNSEPDRDWKRIQQDALHSWDG